MTPFKYIIIIFVFLLIPATALVFSWIKLYKKLQDPDSNYYNEAFLTALCLSLLLLVCVLLCL